MVSNTVQFGSALDQFYERFAQWIGVPYVFGTSTGRSAFQLALESLGLEKGAEIIFPVFTFPVIPLVANLLGYRPVFCDVDPETYNLGPEHIEPKITDRTGAIVATHLFGQPCPIHDVVALARQHDILVLEDCAHACGVRVDGRQVGTFGDIGIFSFAEGKNMPCFGGGAIVTTNDAIAQRAEEILSGASMPEKSFILKTAYSICAKWLLTRPVIFSISAYPILRLKLLLGQPLMDSTVGDDLLEQFQSANPRISRMSNLQASIGLLHLEHIDAFNDGARRNAQLLTDSLGNVPGVTAPRSSGGDHIYVYYPLTVPSERRDDLRHYLLTHGIDSKTTDMCDCSALKSFSEFRHSERKGDGPGDASILEICVYPVISEKLITKTAKTIRAWAGSTA
jgi:dTDP-4-amino-4,6-dideoxygalactose transaminase